MYFIIIIIIPIVTQTHLPLVNWVRKIEDGRNVISFTTVRRTIKINYLIIYYYFGTYHEPFIIIFFFSFFFFKSWKSRLLIGAAADGKLEQTIARHVVMSSAVQMLQRWNANGLLSCCPTTTTTAAAALAGGWRSASRSQLMYVRQKTGKKNNNANYFLFL